jgi:hypothetical protein
MTDPATPATTSGDLPLRVIFAIFGMILGISAALALTILLLPSQAFLGISNYLQIGTAIAGALAFMYAYFRYGRKDCLLYAAGAFLLWGAANSVWYVNTILGRRNEVFPGLIDIGIIASFFLLTVVYQHAFSRRQVAGKLLLAILAFSILVPLAIIIASGITSQTLMIFLYFFACGSLVLIGIIHSLDEYPLILAGTLLFTAAFMIYPIRETFFPANPYLNVIGTFVSAGLALIVLGLVSAISGKVNP